MRRIAALLLVFALLLTACGKKDPNESMTSPFRYYYQPADPEADCGLGAAPFEFRETAGHESDLFWILTDYLSGPVSEELAAPFRRGVELKALEVEDGTVHVLLAQEFAELSGIDMTVACACITMTCLEFPGIRSVTIRAENAALDGAESITMSASNLLIVDQAGSLQESTYVLYYSDLENRYLIGEEVTLGGSQENVAASLLERLISGPTGSGLAETMPVGTAVLSLGISDGVCSINFSRDFVEYSPRSVLAQRLTILSVTNTLTQLDDVEGVAFFVDGAPLMKYGSMDLNQLTTFEERAIGPARTGLNELDLNLYLNIGEGDTLFPLPIRIQQMPNEPVAQQLMEALLAYEDQNGYHTPIPRGTELISVQTIDGCCYVDLSAGFLEGKELEKACSVIAATLTTGAACKSVEIMTEGLSVAHLQWNPEWFAH